jgi:hypothetical protein
MPQSKLERRTLSYPWWIKGAGRLQVSSCRSKRCGRSLAYRTGLGGTRLVDVDSVDGELVLNFDGKARTCPDLSTRRPNSFR